MADTAKYQVVGIGNDYMSDDGVGIYIVEKLMGLAPPHLDLLNCGTDLLRLAPHDRLSQTIIIVDAIRVGDSPGSIHWFAPDDVRTTSAHHSVHQLSILENLKLLPLMNTSFSTVNFVIVGIEPGDLHFEQQLTSQVRQSADQIVEMLKTVEGTKKVIANCVREPVKAG